MVYAAVLYLKAKGPVRPMHAEACRSRVADVHIRPSVYVDVVDEHCLSLDGSEMATCVVVAAAVAVLRADSALYRRG